MTKIFQNEKFCKLKLYYSKHFIIQLFIFLDPQVHLSFVVCDGGVLQSKGFHPFHPIL